MKLLWGFYRFIVQTYWVKLRWGFNRFIVHTDLLGETAAGMEGVDRDLVIVECGTLRLEVRSSSVESPL